MTHIIYITFIHKHTHVSSSSLESSSSTLLLWFYNVGLNISWVWCTTCYHNTTKQHISSCVSFYFTFFVCFQTPSLFFYSTHSANIKRCKSFSAVKVSSFIWHTYINIFFSLLTSRSNSLSLFHHTHTLCLPLLFGIHFHLPRILALKCTKE